MFRRLPGHAVSGIICGMNIHVDTLQHANDLQKAGIERAHAEAIAKLQARIVGDLIEHELVTNDTLKAELAVLEARMKQGGDGGRHCYARQPLRRRSPPIGQRRVEQR